MRHTSSGLPLFCLLLLVTACADRQPDDCAPGGGITPICSFLPPEDLEVVPGGKALIVGGFSLDNENGDLRVLQLGDGSIEKLYAPGALQDLVDPAEAWGDPACPGPPEGFAAHGIHLSTHLSGSHTLLVVNHTSREAIEWFEITDDDGVFAAAWRGCAVIDEELWINDIAMLPDGGFVASHMMPREISEALFDRPPNDRVETGSVVEWQLDRGWEKVPGTEGALPNGIQLSADGTIIYSNHYLANQTVAIERKTGKRLWTAPVTGAPDNMSITPDGKLLIATHLITLRSIRDDCMLKNEDYCGLGFTLHYLDPSDGTPSTIFEASGAPFGGSTVAVQTGDSIYMGAFAGNRIGRIHAPD
jgi:hypothetical protein